MLPWGKPAGVSAAGEPAAPANLQAVSVSPSHMTLQWTDQAGNEDGFKIERKLSSSSTWELIGIVPADTVRFDSGGMFGDTAYDHRVYAYNANGNSSMISLTGIATNASFFVQRGRALSVHTDADPRKFENTLIKLHNGDLLSVNSINEGTGDTSHAYLAQQISSDGGRTWGPETTLLYSAVRGYRQPGLVRMDNGDLGLIYTDQNINRTQSVKQFVSSGDEGQTWSSPVQITDDTYVLMPSSHDRLYSLSDGRLIVPIYCWNGTSPYHIVTNVFYSDDYGATWQKSASTDLDVNSNPFGFGEYGFYEGALVETGTNELLMVGRTATGWLYASRSDDNGDTWSTPVNAGIRHPNGIMQLARLDSGTIALFRSPRFNSSEVQLGKRYQLVSQISTDGGATWTNYKEIEYANQTDYYYSPAVRVDGSDVYLSYGRIASGYIDTLFTRLKTDWLIDDKPLPAPQAYVEARWKLDGDALDAEGNHPGAALNSPSYVSGIHQDALSFNGTNQYVSVPDEDSLDPDMFSIALWVKGGSVGSDRPELIEKQGSSGSLYQIWADGLNRLLKFDIKDGSDQLELTAPLEIIEDNQWHQIVGVKSSRVQAALYVDGEVQATGTKTNLDLVRSDAALTIAKGNNGYYNGQIDDVIFYSMALTPSQAARLFHSVAVWHFDESSGTAAADESGNGIDGTLVNGPQRVAGHAGQALQWNGIDQYAVFPDHASLDFGAGEFSVALWVKSGYFGSGRPEILEKQDANGVLYQVWADGQNRKLIFVIKDGAHEVRAETGLSIIEDNQWHQIVGVRDSQTSVALYVDGQWKASGTNSLAGSVSSAADLLIGQGNNGYFGGLVDEAGIYNRAWNAQEAAELYLDQR